MYRKKYSEGDIRVRQNAVDRIIAGKEKRGAPKGLQVVRINFGMESQDYGRLTKVSEESGMSISDYCMNILQEHVRSSNV